jgi:hypothetical protein
MMIKFDDAPENVRNLAYAIGESIGPDGIPAISPKAALIFGKQVGLDANAYIGAVRWLAAQYAARAVSRTIADSQMFRSAANHFEAFAVALEKASRENAETASCVDGASWG